MSGRADVPDFAIRPTLVDVTSATLHSYSLHEYTLEDLDALARERPEFGRIEIIEGSLVAEGAEMTGDRHQGVVQAIFLALVDQQVDRHRIRLDTYWFASSPTRLRPDIAIYRQRDRPADGGAYRVPPLAIFEVVSDNADHDLVRKRAIYREHGVVTWFVDPKRRHGWWLSDGADETYDGETATIELPDRPPVTLERAMLDA